METSIKNLTTAETFKAKNQGGQNKATISAIYGILGAFSLAR